MDCNKEEAIRARGIAELKLQSRDFSGARKVALRAQKLCHDLENISQILVVCDVHCAAEKKWGSELDYYGILQVEQTADEATITKQYRKLALRLHPDKNKYPGAESAFKLIGEARIVLLDKGKRAAYDVKLKAAIGRPPPPTTHRPPQRQSWFPKGTAQSNVSSNFTGFSPQHQQQPQQPTSSGFSNGRQTFWTKCPYCTVRYQYYIEILHRSLRCQSCAKTFVAYDSGAVPQATNLNQPKFPGQKGVHNQAARKVEQKNQGENSRTSFPSTGAHPSHTSSDKVNGRGGRKQAVESSDSCDTESSNDADEDVVISENGDVHMKKNFGSDGEVRRSGRRKQQVSYNENSSDDEDLRHHSKRAKVGDSSCATKDHMDDQKEDAFKIKRKSRIASDGKADTEVIAPRKGTCLGESLPKKKKETEKVCVKETAKEGDSCNSEVHVDRDEKNAAACLDFISVSASQGRQEESVYVYPDPDFNDFDQHKKKECFSVGQVWAVYDTLDAMPRFYALIRKVFTNGFKLRMTWLEPDPNGEYEAEWANEGLPVSCGNFRHGDSENTEDRLMFSHLTCCESGPLKGAYKIYPRKGETWALFKNWDIKWMSDPGSHRKYEYEFVEILSDFSKDEGVCVAYLAKLKGFVSVFYRIVKGGVDVLQIPSSEVLRFSHRVPSFKLSGEEREGVPAGSFELDSAAVPVKLEEESAPQDLKVAASKTHLNGSCSLSPGKGLQKMGPDGVAPVEKERLKTDDVNLQSSISNNAHEGHSSPSGLNDGTITIPDPLFYDFDADKAPENFQVGQIWALYSDEDGLPKYYGEIKKIQTIPVFKLYLKWLAPCSSQDVIWWQDKKMPVGCGKFRVRNGKSQSYSDTFSFSHQSKAELTDKKNECAIFPRKGEVWAIYRNWTAEIHCSDLENWEFDVGEVVEETDSLIKVLVLERVDGFHSVFKAQVNGGSDVIMEIPRPEILRFSHQIPAFRLTEEMCGSLRGFWELDPAALPVYFFTL